MKKTILLMSVLLAWTASLLAQITREQADAIVREHIQKEVNRLNPILSVNNNAPSEEGIVLTTHQGETFKVKYACWVYFLNEYPDVNGPAQRRYFFVKEDTGNLLEVITSNDFSPEGGLTAWTNVNLFTGLADPKEKSNQSPYPNPVDEWLTIPYTGDYSRIEIHDLKGSCLFSGSLSGKDACQLNVSFLSAGIYMVNINGKTYKIVKN